MQLVVTGHSLGAGTASVLAFLLRRLYPDTVCYAYSPPGCVFNAAAAEASRSFVTSVTFGEDFDPLHRAIAMHALTCECDITIHYSVWLLKCRPFPSLQKLKSS